MTRLQKEIEFPLFRLGTVPDNTGTPVTFTPELLREMEKNSTFVTQAGIFQAPVKYDHPAFGTPDKENHGKMVRYQVRNNTLFAVGTNWSERLQADKAREARIAYSPEFASEFSYIDPESGKTVKLGPTIVGLAMLGSDRPAWKGMKPLAKFEFGENVGPADAFMMREELRSAGMVSEYCEDARYFAEVENDERRFFSEQRTEEQTPMTEAEKLEMQNAINAAVAGAVAPLKAANAELEQKITSFSETATRKAEAHTYCEDLGKSKPLGKLPLQRLEDILTDPTIPTAVVTKVKAFAEALPAFIAPGGVAGEKKQKGKQADDGGAADDEDTDEPKALATVRPKHFADIDNPASQAIIDAAVSAFAEFKPDAFKGIEQNEAAQFAKVREYVINRDTAPAAN